MRDEGLGPCKRASQANQGTIDINLPAADQTAVIAITAHSPTNTRVKLICTDITDVGAFTVRAVYDKHIFPEVNVKRYYPLSLMNSKLAK